MQSSHFLVVIANSQHMSLLLKNIYTITTCYKSIRLYSSFRIKANNKIFDEKNGVAFVTQHLSIMLYSMHVIYDNDSRYSMNLSLFSLAVVVGLPRSSLAPIEHFTSIKESFCLFLAASSSLSKTSKLSTDTA